MADAAVSASAADDGRRLMLWQWLMLRRLMMMHRCLMRWRRLRQPMWRLMLLVLQLLWVLLLVRCHACWRCGWGCHKRLCGAWEQRRGATSPVGSSGATSTWDSGVTSSSGFFLVPREWFTHHRGARSGTDLAGAGNVGGWATVEPGRVLRPSEGAEGQNSPARTGLGGVEER